MFVSNNLMRAAGLATALSILGGSGASSVTTTNFDFSGSGGLDASYFFNVDGIGLTVTAGTFGRAGTAQIGQYSGGLGVTSEAGDAAAIDGRSKNDILFFSFDQVVRIESVEFTDSDSNDHFRFFYEDAGALTESGSNIQLDGVASYAFGGSWVGTMFGIGAWQRNDNFYIGGINVSKMTTVVPLPSALLLILSALGLLAGVRWQARPSCEGSVSVTT
jgi:hypothetical protein